MKIKQNKEMKATNDWWLSRILFAAARGAEIQYPDMPIGHWSTFTEHLDIKNTDDLRILPDDEHLQYGPVSTELRALARMGCSSLNGISPEYWYAVKYKVDGRDGPFYMQDEDHQATYLLFVAEALADQGL